MDRYTYRKEQMKHICGLVCILLAAVLLSYVIVLYAQYKKSNGNNY
jgi:hypothetical protein